MAALGREPTIADEASIPTELEAIVIRALVKDPERRPTAAELGGELRHYLETGAHVGVA
jgi:hypothetical protein